MKLFAILTVATTALWEEDCFRKSPFFGDITMEQSLDKPTKYPMKSDEARLKALADPTDYHVSSIITCTKGTRILS